MNIHTPAPFHALAARLTSSVDDVFQSHHDFLICYNLFRTLVMVVALSPLIFRPEFTTYYTWCFHKEKKQGVPFTFLFWMRKFLRNGG